MRSGHCRGTWVLTTSIIVAVSCWSCIAASGEPEWRVGFARVCITPEKPVWLYGYAGKWRFQPFEGVFDDLFATAMAIQSGDGEPAVLITADLCVLRKPEAEQLCKRLMEKTGLERRHILLNWSHTHSGPMIGTSDTNRYPISEADLAETKAYTARLWEKLAEAAAKALADLAPAQLRWGVGEIGFVMNRRRFDSDGKYKNMGANPDGPVDRTVPVVCVEAPDGKLRGVVFGTSCHAVTLGSKWNKVSGDFPSYARKHIEQELPGVTSLFVQNCGADANPEPRSTANQDEIVQKQGEQLGAEVCRVAAGPLQTIHGPLRTAYETVNLPLKAPPSAQRLAELAEGPFWESHNACRIRDAQACGDPIPTHYAAPLALWQFGNDLTLVAISGEVVYDYVPLVNKALGTERVWVAGYSNEVFGYLPSARIVGEGGYETLGLVSAHIGWFAAETEQVLLDAVQAMRTSLR